MNDEAKTSVQSIDDLSVLRGQIAELERDLLKALTEKDVMRERQAQFQRMVENIGDVIFEVDHLGVILYFSPIGKDIWGYDQEDIIGKNFIEFVHPDDRDILIKRFVELSKGVEYPLIYRIKNKSGEFRWVRTKTKTRIEKGKFIGAIGTLIDVSDQKRMEETLRESEELFRNLVDYMHDAMIIISWDGSILFSNRAAARIIEYDRAEELVGHNIVEYIHPDSLQKAAEDLEAVKADKMGFLSEYQLRSVTGRHIWVESVGGKIIFRGDPANLVCIRDITSRKRAEEQIKSSLKEKEVLLKELQHRVKNNLLTISGILALQLERIKDRESKDIFITSMNRIKAMTRIHTRLYQSGNYSHINFKGYIEELAWELSRSYGFPPENMITDIEDISIDINTAIPAGLIVNELVSNVMKHAFPSLGAEDKGTGQPYRDRNGKITITLKERPALQPAFAGEARAENSEAPHPPLVILTVSDNGIGFPAHIDFRNTESVGLSLLAKLVEQINGSMELTRENGTIFIITFSRI